LPEPGAPIGSPFDEVPTVPTLELTVPLVAEVPLAVELVEIEAPWLPVMPTLDGVAVPDEAPFVDVVDVAAGATWPIPMGFWKVELGCVLTGAPERPMGDADPLEDPVPEPVPAPELEPAPVPEPPPPPPLAKAGSDVQHARVTINTVSFLEAIVRSRFHR
jgi:hypothetical protein